MAVNGFKLVLYCVLCLGGITSCQSAPKATKIYWFIPDGTRADPELFRIFEWAEAGKLPNLKRMMKEGVYGYSVPDFPSHTPTNFASLLTGSHPSVHGISDGGMRKEGEFVKNPSASGFSSQSKKVETFFAILEREYKKKVLLVSIPGTTPPLSKESYVIRGRWGNWGIDNVNMVLESPNQADLGRFQSSSQKLFYGGVSLTQVGVKKGRKSEKRLRTELYSFDLHGSELLVESNSSPLLPKRFSISGSNVEGSLQLGFWSDWLPIKIKYSGWEYPSSFRLKLSTVRADGSFRIRVIFNQLNSLVTQPQELASLLTEKVGPMIDYADNWPHQLVIEAEDRETFLDEMRMSIAWHRDAADFLLKEIDPDIYIQDIYTPNLMLESRWWHHGLVNHNKREWEEVLEMYQGLDSILGQILAHRDSNTIVAFSSDHGVCELKKLVRINNILAKNGWLVFKRTGRSLEIDWERSQAVYTKMAHIYVSPDGLGSRWSHQDSLKYKILREKIRSVLKDIKWEGSPVFKDIHNWELAVQKFDLPRERIGDLVVEANLGFFGYEELTGKDAYFLDPVTSGYKQSIDGHLNNCMWTPFAMMGPGIPKGKFLEKPIENIDQVPSFLKAMGIPRPDFMQGHPIF